ncbi:LOW QUALITY PROTEIN: hypothetical protein HID58_020634, partial [Brassica napus]
VRVRVIVILPPPSIIYELYVFLFGIASDVAPPLVEVEIPFKIHIALALCSKGRFESVSDYSVVVIRIPDDKDCEDEIMREIVISFTQCPEVAEEEGDKDEYHRCFG